LGHWRPQHHNTATSSEQSIVIAVSFLTGLFSFIAIVSGSTLLVLIYLDNRNVRIDDGIANFRRHIDALSPEARQSSVHRNNPEDRRN
jgi:hypothetical protein